ncbi:MAG: UvrD-helicase domain-containing protein [Syntrophaceticus sp.]|nr:UvrD-helicase domain-containing protein [Syntrophaceticus sp.]MDD3314945.1 UvrD-helicase domain-containing protein [Syntrophaceticus sp.]MDD4359167.1 UvrD-helicase domain-containing protein [Syntrophaceticus sp.]MDD4782079.1 UvrD-helicase domain-containing protein [Syntrophaceticus sp.]
MSKHVLIDEAARQAIIRDLDICLLVEAGAGSGKTSSLVQRMTALIKEGKCQVDTLAAITFTRKAAAELKGRFQLALEEAFAEEPDQVKKERLDQALGKLERCYIGTVHSFCAVMLRERPVEAGIDPSFEEIEELDDKLLRRKAWDDYLLEIQLNKPEQLESLSKIGCSPEDLYGFYETLLTYPDVKIVRKKLPIPDFSQVCSELDDFLDWAQGLLPTQVPEKGWDNLQLLINDGVRLRKLTDLNNPLNLLHLLTELNRSGAIVQNRWRDPQEAKDVKAAFDEFKEYHLLPALKQWWEYRHAFLVDFVQPAVGYYQELKKGKSKLNFQDLLLRTASLLRDNPEVRCYFQKRFTHILVDEFQDTDPIQAEIMFYLTCTDVLEKDWRCLEPRPGSLFVVGDPRQSIYRFRRADIDTYNEVKTLLRASGGQILTLTTNFRSEEAVGKWINSIFQDIFPEQATPYQAAFAPLNTVRSSARGFASGVRVISIPKVARNKKREIVNIDAKKIACFISGALNGEIKLSRTMEEKRAGLTEKPKPADFLILLCYKEMMDVYARALEEKGIAFKMTGGSGFSESQEMKNLLNVFKALLDPSDPVHLLAVLRCELCGVSDQAIWKYKSAGGHFNIYEQLPDGLDHETGALFAETFTRLSLYCQWVRQLPVSTAVAKIMSDLGSVPSALAGEQGKARAGYLVQAVELVAAAERQGITSFSELVSHLEETMETGVEEEIDLNHRNSNNVRLMNLHKAKGLESPVVILANPAKNSGFAPDVHISRSGNQPTGYFLVEKRNYYNSEILGQPVHWERFAQTEEQYQEAEEKRLLYVAATRAKNLLVISTYPTKPDLSPWVLFNEKLADCPVLDGLDDRKSSGMIRCEKEDLSLEPGDLEQARINFFTPRSKICTPSYRQTAVTSLVKSGGSFPKREATGRGMSWGRVIHRVMEAYANSSQVNLETFIETVLAEEGRLLEEKEEVLQYVQDTFQSPFWERVAQSKKRFVEIPFAQQTADLTIVSGVIDLVFYEHGGWVVVDYKTDTVKDEDELRMLADYYSPQLVLYRSFWEKITGEKVVEAGFYFTSIGRWVSGKNG